MKLARVNRADLQHIALRLRQRDREELYATRWCDDPFALVEDTLACGDFGWVVGRSEPTAAIGAALMWPGHWSVWAYGTDAWPSVALGLTRHVKRVMIPALLSAGMQRAECRTLDRHVDAHRWLEVLGAEKEAEHPCYGRDGETFFTYVWFRDKLIRTYSTISTNDR